MKKLNYCWSCVLVLALLFTSCSKDEASDVGNNADKVALSFGAVLNDLSSNRAAAKAHLADFPVCSSADPDYVKIVLTQGGSSIVGTMAVPFKIDLVEGQLFTEDVPELELEAGIYSLDYFAVYDANNNLIWIAPKTGGSLANFVDEPLSLPIDLRKGVKKYVDVTVLCFEDRMVNEYGYLFFEINPEKALEFCFFANYCDDSGRHFPASYSVNIWKGTDNTGAVLYSNVPNAVGQYDNGDYYANALCFALPDNDALNTPYLYYEVTLLDWPLVYGDVPQTVISGTLTKQDILDNHVGDSNVEYEHLRFNCGDQPPSGDPCPGQGHDDDNDNRSSACDNCPDVYNPSQTNSDEDSLGDKCDNCPNDTNQDQLDSDVDEFGNPNPDGVGDVCDSCPLVNPEDDNDGDCKPNNEDPCPDDATDSCDEGGDACGTGFMFGDVPINSLDNSSNRWGWLEHWTVVDGQSITKDFWVGAGQNDTDKGSLAGTITLTRDGDELDFDINLINGYTLSELHVQLSENEPSGKVAKAPGQYNRNDEVDPSVLEFSLERENGADDSDFWVIIHGVACNK